MVDLKAQYLEIKEEIDNAIHQILMNTQFIKGEAVENFENELSTYLDNNYVISCGNGTDALQIALMALDLEPGDEVICPSFSYAATLEVIALLKLTPVVVDVNADDFNIDPQKIRSKISDKTKAIIAVHLFGQQASMLELNVIANEYNLFVIEDNAQSMGSINTSTQSKSAFGHIATTSFFPSKNLGCYGDGGAIYTKDKTLAQKIRMIANHGQSKKYIHDIIGVNSRLDGLQAAILSIKLKHLNHYIQQRKYIAHQYDHAFHQIEELNIPKNTQFSDHIFHQYTLKVNAERRDEFANFLKQKSIPYSIYYPLPMHKQKAYLTLVKDTNDLAVSEQLCKQVISLPIHPHLISADQEFIIENIINFFN